MPDQSAQSPASDDATDIAISPNLTLLPGAAQNCRDQDQPLDPVTARIALDFLAGCEHPGRILIAGWAPAIVSAAVAAGDDVHVLLRGVEDAQTAARDFPTATVWCGDPRRLPVGRFDAVIAPFDLAVLQPADAEPTNWRSAFHALRGSAPAGLFVVENELGMHRLADPRAADRRTWNRDTDWQPMQTFDSTRPTGPAELAAACETATASVWSLFPGSSQPSVAARYGADVSAAEAAAYAQRALERPGHDSGWLVRAAARAGDLDRFAAAWLIVVGGPDDADPLLVTGPDGVQAVEERLGPSAELLATTLTDAAAAPDVVTLKATLRAYSDWLDTLPTDTLGHAASLTEVAGTATGLRLLPAARAYLEIDDPTTAFNHAAADLIVRIRTSGLRSPWPDGDDDQRLLRQICATVGREARADALTAVRGIGADGSQSPAELPEPAETAGPTEPGLAAALGRIAELESRAAWFERRLNDKEAEVWRVRGEQRASLGKLEDIAASSQAQLITERRAAAQAAADVRTSTTFRVGQALVRPARRTVAAGRRLARRLRH